MKNAFEKAIAKKAEKKSIGCAGSASCAGPAGGKEGCISMHNPPGLLQKIAMCKAFSTPLP